MSHLKLFFQFEAMHNITLNCRCTMPVYMEQRRQRWQRGRPLGVRRLPEVQPQIGCPDGQDDQLPLQGIKCLHKDLAATRPVWPGTPTTDQAGFYRNADFCSPTTEWVWLPFRSTSIPPAVLCLPRVFYSDWGGRSVSWDWPWVSLTDHQADGPMWDSRKHKMHDAAEELR